MLTDLAIRRPILTAMMSLTILVLGGVSFFRVGVDMFPDVSFPFVTVVTLYPGAGPQDVEQDVTRPIEDRIAGIPGAQKLFSHSIEHVSLVFMEFSMETDVDVAVQQVRERVEGVERELPEGAERPVVRRFDVRAFPVLTYSLAAGNDPERARNLAEDEIKPALEQIPGVAQVRVSGGRRREIQVQLDPERLEAYGLSPGQVFQRLRQENVSIPSGQLESGPSSVGVRVDARVMTAEEVGEVIVSGGSEEQLRSLGRTVEALARGGQTGVASLPSLDETPVRVRDVGEVVETFADERSVVRLDGGEAVILEVVKQAGGNSVEIAAAVYAVLEQILDAQPDDVVLTTIRDEAQPIMENAHDVERALVVGGVMAVLVILIFLVDWRGTVISALALPVSVVGTFAIMAALGFTLNLLTLMGLALAIGLLIDDSVVVRESITRRLELGDDPFKAASEGTREIRLAVIATSLTICAVFVPVAFMTGMVGQFFQEFGLVVAGAVLLSTFVALTLDPMLSARIVRAYSAGRSQWRVALMLRSALAALDGSYKRVLDLALRHPIVTVAIGLAAFGAGLALAPVLGFEFIPGQDRGRFIVRMRFPAATSLDESSRRSLAFERAVLRVDDVRGVQCLVGEDDDARQVRCSVMCSKRTERPRERTLQDIKDDVRRELAKVPQAVVAMSEVPILEALGDYPPIVMQIRGPDLAKLREHADRIAGILREVDGTSDIDVNYSPGLPELAVTLDRDRVRERGLSAYDVALQARLALNGEVAGTIRRGRRAIDVRVRLAEAFRRDPDTFADLLVAGPRGMVRLGDVGRVEPRTGPVSIAHQDRMREISVYAQVVGRPLGDVVRDLHARIDGLEWGDGYTLHFSGMQEEMQKSNEAMALALALALVFIYIILASQFESLVHPFTIVLSLPLGFLGAFLALLASGSAISLPAMLGLILLIGLCAKNGILLVDGALQRMREGLSPYEAMALAGPRRLRPIVMTSAAMIFGMLPTALASETGSEFRRPMAVAVIGGVISNTLLTLLVLPVVFVLMERLAGVVRPLLGVKKKA